VRSPPGSPMCWSALCASNFAFVRLCDPKGGAAFEATRGNTWTAFPRWLASHGDRVSRKEVIPDVGDPDTCHGVVIPIGVGGEGGLVAAACARSDFPSEIDQLLLSVAANRAATAFQSLASSTSAAKRKKRCMRASKTFAERATSWK
jgi:hypothetical protein